MKERKFRPKLKITDDRQVKNIQKAIPGVRAYSSNLSRTLDKQRREASDKASKAAFKKAHPNKTHYSDYKPPIHGKRNK
jgi:hypothetical protein